MKKQYYLFDTYALLFWSLKKEMSVDFIQHLDHQNRLGHLFASSITFWEIALLAQKGKLALPDVQAWKNELLNNTNLKIIEPTVDEMIGATLLPNHHKDPFDRLLVIQANRHKALLVTQDSLIQPYEVQTFWM